MSEAEQLLCFHRGLEPVHIGPQWYLLPTACRHLAAGLNRLDWLSAVMLHDYLLEQGAEVPAPVLVLLKAGRTADKRSVVRDALLQAGVASRSNREIARRCGVSEGLVRKVRAELSAHCAQMDAAPEPPLVVKRGG
jgi:hypothetical protein